MHLLPFHAARLVHDHHNRSLAHRLGRTVFAGHALALDQPAQGVVLELGDSQLRQLLGQQPAQVAIQLDAYQVVHAVGGFAPLPGLRHPAVTAG